jgi:hypothetical protein
VTEVGWVPGYLADLESDFSAIHHIIIDFDGREYGGISSRRFFLMAERLPAYQGVMQARLMAEHQRQEEQRKGGRGATSAPTIDAGAGPDGVKVIPLTPEMAAHGMAALGLAGVVDYATSG